MSAYRVIRPAGSLRGTMNLPASKSISNRLLILDALFSGKLRLQNSADADDTHLLRKALTQHTGKLDLQNAGTAFRFLTAYLARGHNTVELHGSARMESRPIGALVDALRSLGAQITYLKHEGFPPIRIRGTRLTGGAVSIDGSESSQFVSALMLIAPVLENGLRIRITGTPSSTPYVSLTAALMNQVGLPVEVNDREILVRQGEPVSGTFGVEADWSAASYGYLLAMLSKSEALVLNGLSENDVQGDKAMANLMRSFGVNTTFGDHQLTLHGGHPVAVAEAYPLSDTPDLVPALAVAAAVSGAATRFTGIGHLKLKESNRLLALETELRKCGVEIRAGSDWLKIEGRKTALTSIPRMATYGDHRMAMAFAPLALELGAIIIEDPEVVSKSFPGYWHELRNLGFTLEEIN